MSFGKENSDEFAPSVATQCKRGATASRAVQLALETLRGDQELKQRDVMRVIPPRCGAEELADALARRSQLEIRVAELSCEQMLAGTGTGASIILETQQGWAVLRRRGIAGRPRLTEIDAGGERETRATRSALRRLLGEEHGRAVLVESRPGLQELRASNETSKSPWSRLAALVSLENRDLLALVAHAMVLGALSLAVPVAVQVLVNTIALGSLLQPLLVLSVLLAGVLTFSGLIHVLQALTVEFMQRRVFVRVAEDFARRLPNMDFEARDHADAIELSTRFFEVVSLQKALSKLLIDGSSLVLQTFVSMLLLAFYHPVLLAFDVALIASMLLLFAVGRGAVSSAVQESKAKYKVASWLRQVASNPYMFARDAGAVSASLTSDALTRDYLAARRTHYSKLLRQLIGGVAIQVIAMVVLLGLGGWLVMQGELTLGQLVAAELVVGVVGIGFAKSGKFFESGYDLLASLDKIGELLDQPDAGETPDESGSTAALSVELRGLGVERSDGSSSAPLSAEFRSGARVHLAGPGGSGKSKLLETIAGRRSPAQGELRLRARDGRVMRASTLRESMVLLRPTEVVEGDVLENLRIGDLELDEKRAWELLRAVQLHDRVGALSGGLHARLSSSGQPLSSSEVARLCLARALAARPSLLLIDEGLDRLGLEGEQLEALLDVVLGPDAPWSVWVVSKHPDVLARCAERIHLTTTSKGEAA